MPKINVEIDLDEQIKRDIHEFKEGFRIATEKEALEGMIYYSLDFVRIWRVMEEHVKEHYRDDFKSEQTIILNALYEVKEITLQRMRENENVRSMMKMGMN